MLDESKPLHHQLRDELQELLGDEFQVKYWLVDYTWDAIEISKGGKTVRIFPRNIQMTVNGNVETE